MGPEKRIENKIKAWLDRQPETWYFKVHGGPYQVAGVPDLIGVTRGRAWALEVKTPGEVPTAIQTRCMRLLARSGAIVAVVTSLEEAQAALAGL